MALPKSINEYTFNDVRTRIGDAVSSVPLGKNGFDITYQMVEQHNFWSPGGVDGDGWGGQRSSELLIQQRILEQVYPMFTPDDVVGEIVANVDSGLLKREATMTFSPLQDPPGDEASERTEARKKKIAVMQAALSRWWDNKKYWEHLGKAARRGSWSGRGELRFRIPPAKLQNGRLPTRLTLDEALDIIEVDAPLPDQACVFVDPQTARRVGLVVSKIGDRDTAEIWTIEQDKRTRCRVVDPANVPGAPVDQEGLELGGRIPVFELEMDPLITEPMRRQQIQLNFIRTVLGRTIEAAGFKARYISNAEPPLMWLEDPPRLEPVVKEIEQPNGKKLYGVAMPWIFGAGFTTEVLGIEKPTIDPSIPAERHDPTITIDEPTDTKFVTDPADSARLWIFQAGKQGHLGSSATVQLSGDAYEQARAQHEADLVDRAGPVESMARDSLECLIALAALMSDEARGFLDEFRAVVQLNIHAGPMRPDQARVNFEAFEKNIISLHTTQSRFGIEDTDAEGKLLEKDDWAKLALWTKRFATLSQATLAGVELLVACFLIGLTKDQAEMIVTGKVPGWESLFAEVERMRQAEADRARTRTDNGEDPNQEKPPGSLPPRPAPAVPPARESAAA